MYANNICTTCTAAITRVQRHSKTARRKPLLIFFLVLGFCILFCIFSVIRSSQTLSSLQYHTIENLVKIFNQTEKDSNTATGNTRQDHDKKCRKIIRAAFIWTRFAMAMVNGSTMTSTTIRLLHHRVCY